MHIHAGLDICVPSDSRLDFESRHRNLFVRNLAVVRKINRDGCTYMIIEEMMITEIQPIDFERTNLQQQG